MRVGDVVAGRFELTRLAGTGGMARVYRAIDKTNGAVVAVKLLHTDEADDVGRFTREASVLAELSHPGVVRYVAHGSTPDGPCFLAMEWLDGEDLGDRLRRGALQLAHGIALGRRVGEALGATHRRGVIHRDIKPSNLFLPEGDIERVKLLDFGIARVHGVTRRLTRSGMTMGTPGYMSPEQARGEGEMDPRTDVFALGCVLFECLTGQPAFEAGHSVAVLSRILFDDPPPLRSLCPEAPVELEALLARMLSKPAAERPADGDAVARELSGFDRRSNPPAAPAPPVRSLGRAEQRIVSVVVAAAPGVVVQSPTVPWTTFAQPASSPRSSERVPTDVMLIPPAHMTKPTQVGPPPAATLDGVREAVRAHGGRVEVLADGTVVTLLPGSGTPTEQAARAARCALAVRARLPSVPVVLATGRGVVDARYPVGEVIDRAVRALDSAPPDAVGIDEVTAGLLDSRFEVELPQGAGSGDEPMSTSGRRVALLRGERGGGDAQRTLLGKATPCVGRDRELSLLMAAWNDCITEPAAAGVLITGEAGVGKSRLVHEFLRRVIDPGRRVHVVVARAEPTSAGSAYGMIAPATRRLAGVLDGEPLETSRKKVLTLVSARVPAARAAWVATFVGELAGVTAEDSPPDAGPESSAAWEQLRAAKRDPMLMGDQMRAAWVEWMASVSAAEPLLVVLDDLQWGDQPTVQLVDVVLKRLRDMPFMVLAVARPEVRERFPRLWPDRTVISLPLAGLSKRASERLVREVLGEQVTEAQVHSVVSRADGNALYLEELIRAAAAGQSDGLPTTVLGMVQARFDALDPEARRALRAASVFGRTFWRGGVAALLGPERGTVAPDEWLEELAARELVAAEASATFPYERQYSFRHDLVRDAAYAMLTPNDCALGHRLAAEWLERSGERDPVTLAVHFELGGDRARAAVRWGEAAQEALEASDLDAAVDRAQRGIACGAQGDTLGMLLLTQAEAHGWKGDLEQAERCAESAPQYLPRGVSAWFRAVGELVYASAPLRKNHELTAWGDRLRATRAVDDHAAAARVVALCRTAIQLELVGLHHRGTDLLRSAEEGAATLDADVAMTARLEQARGFVAVADGDLVLALQCHLESADSFLRAGAHRNRAAALTHASFMHLELGCYEDAEKNLRESLATAERAGIKYNVMLARTNLAMALLRLGRLADAVSTGSHAAATMSGFVDLRLDAVSRGYLAEILAAGGDLEGAEREARKAAQATGAFPPFCARALGALAHVLLARKRPAEACEAATQGMRLLETLGTCFTGESLLRMTHAKALHETNATDEARAAMSAARDRLLERAARIADVAVRETFLHRVPENAETLALAAAWTAG
jgi:serine/threonine protein kinase/predicted ATPase